MLHLYDRATMAHALTLDLDPQLRSLLESRFASLVTVDGDLTDWTEYLVVAPGDTEEDIVLHVSFSPLVEPITGVRFGEPGFHPGWDWLGDHGGWFEMIVTFGSTFAYVLLVKDRTDDLGILCKQYSDRSAA